MWSVAFHDASAATPIAAELLKHKSEEIRFVATAHLCQLGLPNADRVRAVALDDNDLRIAWWAASAAPWAGEDGEADESMRLFERFQRLFDRLPPKPVELKPILWPWTSRKASRADVAQLMPTQLGKRPPTALIPYLSAMSKWTRRNCIQWLAAQKKWDGLTRETLIRLGGDTSSDVREEVYKVLAKVKLQPHEIVALEGYLTRKSNDVRQGVLPLLLAQTDTEALTSSERLLAASDPQQRLAGLEVLRELTANGRCRDECQSRADAYRAGRRKVTLEEQVQIDGILDSAKGAVSLDNGLGLFDPAHRSPAVAPIDRKVKFLTAPAISCLRSLDALIHNHRESPIKTKNWRGEDEEVLLGNCKWNFPAPDTTKPRDQQAALIAAARNLGELARRAAKRPARQGRLRAYPGRNLV